MWMKRSAARGGNARAAEPSPFLMKTSTTLIGWAVALPLAAVLAHAKARVPDPAERVDTYNLTTGEPVKIPARDVRLPLYVFGEETNPVAKFVPSGYMGDSQSISIKTAYSPESAPAKGGEPGKTMLEVTYKGKGREGWAGVYWLTPANNWGRVKGAGFDLSKADRLTFWLRGARGGERIAAIKVGGVNGDYPDSDEASLGAVRLSQDWEKYTIDLKGKDLRHIIGGFCFVVRRSDNPRGATFYLDEVVFEEAPEPPKREDDRVTLPVDPPQTTAAAETAPEPAAVRANPVATATKPQREGPPLLEEIRRTVLFTPGHGGFTPEEQKILMETIDLAGRFRNAPIVVEGHTDSIGPADVNMRLSRERAAAVADFLAANGVDRSRITVIGYGEERPVSPDANKTPEGRLQNRRAEIVLQADAGGRP